MKIGIFNYFSLPGLQQRSGVAAIAKRLQIQYDRRDVDTVTIQPKFAGGREELGTYKPGANHMVHFEPVPYTNMESDESLQRELLPSSEVDSYTEQDALLNQYMKQYHELDKNGGKLPPNTITDEELEQFRKELSEQGLGEEIDWRAVEHDFWNIGVNIDKVERLEMKVDYLASRYAVLKDRIQKQYSGDEHTQQMGILDKLYNEAKEEIADTYAEQIGGFYEDLGAEGTAEDFRTSIRNVIDEKSADYEAYLSENNTYTEISSSENSWLLQDDGYMAAQLRERYASEKSDIQTTAQEEHYTMEDLMFAGVYAKSLSSQLQDVSEVWSTRFADNDLGVFMAKQSADTQAIAGESDLSVRMEKLVGKVFRPYMDKFMDELDKGIDRQREMVKENPWMSYRTEYIDRNSVYNSYQNALDHL